MMQKTRIKKSACMTVFMTVMMSLCFVATSLAGPPVVPPAAPPAAQAAPGCSPEYKAMQDNHSDASRVEDRARQAQTVKRPDPSAGMTCLDQAMGVSARLGNIFSDRHPYAITPANTTAFNLPLVDPNWGADKLLIQSLEANVLPMIGQHIGDFTGSLSELIGGLQVTNILAPITGTIGNITAAIGSVAADVTSVMGMITQIETAVNTFSMVLPSAGVVAALGVFRGLIGQLQGLINTAITAINNIVKIVIDAIMALIMGPATNIQCNRMANVWNDGQPLAGAESIQGNGPELGAPYINFLDILNQNTGGYNVGTDFIAELTSAMNSGILQQALTDITTNLAGPGSNVNWKFVPAIPPNATPQQIIQLMQPGP